MRGANLVVVNDADTFFGVGCPRYWSGSSDQSRRRPSTCQSSPYRAPKPSHHGSRSPTSSCSSLPYIRSARRTRGHLLQIQRPEPVARAMAGFMERNPKRPSGITPRRKRGSCRVARPPTRPHRHRYVEGVGYPVSRARARARDTKEACVSDGRSTNRIPSTMWRTARRRSHGAVSETARARRPATSSARACRRGRRARRRGSRPRRRGSGRSGPADRARASPPAASSTYACSSVELHDRGARRLEHVAEPAVRAGVRRQRLVAGVEDRAIGRRPADDRRVHRQRDVVERGRAGGDRRAVVEGVRARRGTRSPSGGARRSPTSQASRPPRRSRRRGPRLARAATAAARNASAPRGDGVREEAAEAQAVRARRPPTASVRRRLRRRHAGAAEARVAVDEHAELARAPSRHRARPGRSARRRPRRDRGPLEQRASRSSLALPDDVEGDEDVVACPRRPSSPPRRASDR